MYYITFRKLVRLISIQSELITTNYADSWIEISFLMDEHETRQGQNQMFSRDFALIINLYNNYFYEIYDPL